MRWRIGLRGVAGALLTLLLAGCGAASAQTGSKGAGALPKGMVGYWNFTKAKGLLGWSQKTVYGMTPTNNYPKPSSSTDSVSFKGGALDAHVTGPDAWILSPDLAKMNLQGASVGSLVLRLRLQPAGPASTDWVELYWANDISGTKLCCNGEYAPGNWGQSGSITTSALTPPLWVNADGHWHTLTVPISGSTNTFTGQIYAFRIDLEQPQSQAPTNWQIQWIGLTEA